MLRRAEYHAHSSQRGVIGKPERMRPVPRVGDFDGSVAVPEPRRAGLPCRDAKEMIATFIRSEIEASTPVVRKTGFRLQ